MKANKIIIKRIVVLSIPVLVLLIISGYRLTGIQAAKAHFAVGRDVQLLGQVQYDWGSIYILNTPKGYRTAISERYGFLWRTQDATYMFENSDLIKTVGGVSVLERATVYAVEVTDEKVSYIEIGPQPDRIRKYSGDGNPIIFSWDKSISWNDFNGIAYSKEGVPIYEYKYPRDTNFIKHEDLRWYPIR